LIGWDEEERKLFPLGSVKRAFRGVTVRCASDLKCYNDSLTIKHQAEKGMISCMDIQLLGTISAIFHSHSGSEEAGERQSVMKHKKFSLSSSFTSIPFDDEARKGGGRPDADEK
jgi:hypothetical protein